jgi:hypothetical protein
MPGPGENPAGCDEASLAFASCNIKIRKAAFNVLYLVTLTPCINSFPTLSYFLIFKLKSMKQLPFSCTRVCAVMAFFLLSCGGNEEKTTTAAGTDTTTSMPSTTAPAEMSTIVTTPQNMMIARHRVSNFAKWKASYDAHDSLRQVNGLHSYVIGRSVEDSSMVLVAVKADDMARARAFAKDPSLKQAMQKGGVLGTPQFTFPMMVFQDTATLSSDIRAMTTITVKDWDAWRKAFESHKQIRMDNGLQDRAYGYDPEDNHKVTLVLAVMDTAKAQDFWKSDLLKQQREASGVTGTPQRFVFRVVQRY